DRMRTRRTNWLLIKHRDAAARDGDGEVLLADDRSVASGRNMAAIAAGTGRGATPFLRQGRKKLAPDAVWDTSQKSRPRPKPSGPLPEFVPVQLCRAVSRPPSGAGWAHEIKFDGYRVQLRVAAGAAALRTRRGLDWTDKFPAIAAAAASLPDALIDGEIVAL